MHPEKDKDDQPVAPYTCICSKSVRIRRASTPKQQSGRGHQDHPRKNSPEKTLCLPGNNKCGQGDPQKDIVHAKIKLTFVQEQIRYKQRRKYRRGDKAEPADQDRRHIFGGQCHHGKHSRDIRHRKHPADSHKNYFLIHFSTPRPRVAATTVATITLKRFIPPMASPTDNIPAARATSTCIRSLI